MEKRWVSELKVAVEFGGKEESVKKEEPKAEERGAGDSYRRTFGSYYS